MKYTRFILDSRLARWRFVAYSLGAAVAASLICVSGFWLFRAYLAFNMEERGACVSFSYFPDPDRLSREVDGTPSRPWESDTPTTVRLLGPHLASDVTAVSLRGDIFDEDDVWRLRHLRNLRKTCLDGLTLSRATLTELSRLPLLDHIQLFNCVVIGDAPVSYSFPGAYAVLINCQTDRIDFIALGQSQRLKSLHIANWKPSDDAMEALTAYSCIRLQSLLLASPCSENRVDAFRRTHESCKLILVEASGIKGE